MATQAVKSLRARRVLDRRLEPWRELIAAGNTDRPSGGWVQAIREALGMSAQDLADRLDVAGSTVARLERSERDGRVRLDTLERAGRALNCDLVYALVPRQPLEMIVEGRARSLATEELAGLGHTMDLEAQGLSVERLRERVDDLVQELKSRPGLWRDGELPEAQDRGV